MARLQGATGVLTSNERGTAHAHHRSAPRYAPTAPPARGASRNSELRLQPSADLRTRSVLHHRRTPSLHACPCLSPPISTPVAPPTTVPPRFTPLPNPSRPRCFTLPPPPLSSHTQSHRAANGDMGAGPARCRPPRIPGVGQRRFPVSTGRADRIGHDPTASPRRNRHARMCTRPARAARGPVAGSRPHPSPQRRPDADVSTVRTSVHSRPQCTDRNHSHILHAQRPKGPGLGIAEARCETREPGPKGGHPSPKRNRRSLQGSQPEVLVGIDADKLQRIGPALAVNEHEVGAEVTVAAALPGSSQCVVAVPGIRRPVGDERLYDSAEDGIERLPVPSFAFSGVIAFELTSQPDRSSRRHGRRAG